VTATIEVPGHLLVQLPPAAPTPAGGMPGTPDPPAALGGIYAPG
jgi:hypothetical protein